MRKKPSGPKYRNLHARGASIYYERVIDGERIKFSCMTSDWAEAAAVRDLYELRRSESKGRSMAGTRPTFGDFAERYLKEATAHLAPTTLDDRKRMLGEDGRVRAYFGSYDLREITRPALLEWWHLEVERRDRSERTGLTYLSALSGVLGYAVDLELIDLNPVDALRGSLRRRRRSKRGRAAAEEVREAQRPLETPEELRAFVTASRAACDGRFENGRRKRQRWHGHLADILQLDGGLRLGEVAGLRWRDIEWGTGPSDPERALLIREAIARGKHEGKPKSGRQRRVALSKRLRGLLREFYVESGRPGASERVLPSFRSRNYQDRHFARVCTAAKLEGHSPKDLRDTFASQLLTAGIQLGYISRQLGHSDVATTARHYARWTGGDGYRAPFELEDGQVPADLLARIEAMADAPAHGRAHGDGG